MVVTLYLPSKPPRSVRSTGFALPSPDTGYVSVTTRAAQELGCSPELVDVLDCGPDFVAYSIFDYEGEVNSEGTLAVMRWSKHPKVYRDADSYDQLCGPILLVTTS